MERNHFAFYASTTIQSHDVVDPESVSEGRRKRKWAAESISPPAGFWSIEREIQSLQRHQAMPREESTVAVSILEILVNLGGATIMVERCVWGIEDPRLQNKDQ